MHRHGRLSISIKSQKDDDDDDADDELIDYVFTILFFTRAENNTLARENAESLHGRAQTIQPRACGSITALHFDHNDVDVIGASISIVSR